MDALLEEYLSKVEGGKEVLAARKPELAGEIQLPEAEAAMKIREEDRLMHLQRAGRVRVGSSRLSDEFWDLPRPDDPEDSVRRALDQDRG
jgi:hypothetical protein